MEETEEMKTKREAFYNRLSKVAVSFIYVIRGMLGMAFHMFLAFIDGLMLLKIYIQKTKR